MPNTPSRETPGTGAPGFGPISDRQQQVLDFLTETVNDRGYPPSVREICDAVGLSSPSTVHSHLSSLVKAGYIRRDPTKPRAIEILTDPQTVQSNRTGHTDDRLRDVPLVGRIAAGSPILATEDIETVMPLPEELVGSDPVFMLEVRGDSMIDAGILDGDFVVIRRQPDALDGEIIAALVEGEEATVKRLKRQDGQVILLPENPSLEPMVFDDGVEIIGKVVSVLRKL